MRGIEEQENNRKIEKNMYSYRDKETRTSERQRKAQRYKDKERENGGDR